MSCLAVVISAYFLTSPAPKSADPAKAERARWQGAWKVEAMEITTGKRTARLKFTEMDEAALRVKDDAFEMTGLMLPYTSGKLTFDPSGDPKRITLSLRDGPKKGPAVAGTYIMDGEGIELEVAEWPRDKDETVKLRLSLKRMKE